MINTCYCPYLDIEPQVIDFVSSCFLWNISKYQKNNLRLLLLTHPRH